VPDLIEFSGLAENTVRSVINARGKPSRATLVVISLLLGWGPHHLNNLIHGRAADYLTIKSPAETNFAAQPAVSALRADVAGLTEDVHRIDGKIDTIIETLQSPGSPSGRIEAP
jgi:hypothetical protein